jgi:NitT/TauT family transport system substrate-binding protein
MNKRVLRIFSTLILLAVLLSACAKNTYSAPHPPLAIGWSLYPGWYPLVIAEKQGLFEKHGVEVELVFYKTYKETTPPLASGLVDGAAIVLGDALFDDIAEDIKITLITDNSHGADQLIASPSVNLNAAGLQGKRIGVVTGTFGGLLAREMLASYGIKASDVKFVEVQPEKIPGALPDYIDIGHTFEPFASEARAKGNKVIFDSSEVPGLIVDVIAFRKTVLKERPEDVRNFINAWFDAVAYWQANPAQGNQIIADATGQDVKGISAEGIKFFDREANLAAFQPGTDRNSVLYTAQIDMDYLINLGLVTHPTDINAILDPSYLR